MAHGLAKTVIGFERFVCFLLPVEGPEATGYLRVHSMPHKLGLFGQAFNVS